jgi:hypothetical protein
MIRYISWNGEKPSKRIDLSIGNSIEFIKGKPVDIIDAGMSERHAQSLLDTGLFKLHGSKEPVPFDLPEPEAKMLQCQCGFVAKNKAGLKAHMRSCRK